MELVVSVMSLLNNYTGVSCRVGAGERGVQLGICRAGSERGHGLVQKGKAADVTRLRHVVTS